MERKNVIFLTVIAIATLLVAVVGATFAYFSTTVQTQISDNANKASVGTAKYTDSTIIFAAKGNKIDMQDAIPGNSDSTTFTIENKGQTDIPYNIKWTSVSNTFDAEHTNELVYSFNCTGGTIQNKTDITAPTSDTDPNAAILSNVVVTAGNTATCTLTVTFKETGSEQNYNQGKNFQGTVEVTTENISAQGN